MTLFSLICFSEKDDEKNIRENNISPKVNIIIDGGSRDDLWSYGHPVIGTFNIDELANDGIRKTNAFKI